MSLENITISNLDLRIYCSISGKCPCLCLRPVALVISILWFYLSTHLALYKLRLILEEMKLRIVFKSEFLISCNLTSTETSFQNILGKYVVIISGQWFFVVFFLSLILLWNYRVPTFVPIYPVQWTNKINRAVSNTLNSIYSWIFTNNNWHWPSAVFRNTYTKNLGCSLHIVTNNAI